MPDLHAPNLKIFPSREAAAAAAADQIARRLARPAVLGLATGSTLIPVYERLRHLHRAGLSFADTRTFNLDEYWPIAPEQRGSFHDYMRRHLFEHVDLPPAHCRIPDGSVAQPQVAESCRAYEQAIAGAGGIDLQLLGLGRNGHIGFNEPGSPHDSRTRIVTLHQSTRDANAPQFRDRAAPTHAITMGIGTILEARRIVLLAFGSAKARALREALTGALSPDCPASALRTHPNVTVFADPEAARELEERT